MAENTGLMAIEHCDTFNPLRPSIKNTAQDMHPQNNLHINLSMHHPLSSFHQQAITLAPALDAAANPPL
jgi:hypothetical protein